MASISSSAPSAAENFYLHVNKQWLDDPQNCIPSDYSQWGGFTKLHDEGLNAQIEMVKDLKTKSVKNDEEAKISAIWEASVERFAAWERGEGSYSAAEQELAALDAVLQHDSPLGDMNDAIERIAKTMHHTKMRGIRNVFDFDKGSDLTNSNNVVLDFSTSGLSLPSREYYFGENFAPKRDAWRVHIGKVKDLIEGSGKIVLGDDFVDNVISFENDLAKTMMKRSQAREYDKYFTNTTLEGLYAEANTLKSLPAKEENYEEGERGFMLDEEQLSRSKILLERLYTLFDFRRILAANLEKNFGGANATDAPSVNHITAFDGDGIRRVLALLLAPDGAILPRYRSYLQYRTISRVSSYCTKELDEEYFDFFSRTLRGQSEQKTVDKRSIAVVNSFAGEMMGKIFVARLFPPECKEDVRGMIDETLSVMKESIEQADWLTSVTREKALAKLAKFKVKVGYPDKWKDYSDFKPEGR